MPPVGWHLEEERPAFSLVMALWWACQDLNLGPHPDPKIYGEQARGSVRAEPGSDRRGAGCPVRARSGGGLEGDLVAEGLELADVVALGALGTDTGVVAGRRLGPGTVRPGRPADARR